MASIKRIGKDKFDVPVWEAVYWRKVGGESKQVRRRFHAKTREEVARRVALDCQQTGLGLTWSEGVAIYLEAKRDEGCTAESLGHVERALAVFRDIMGDMAIEETTADDMKRFMQAVVVRPVLSPKGKVIRKSGPKVANHHRKELLTVARYLKKHTDKVSVLPFLDVPPLPARAGRRTPIPGDQVNVYLDALPPHVRRPVLMVLVYGLRSTAVCELTPASVVGDHLIAHDKMDVVRRIPVDPFLRDIVDAALAYRATFPIPGAGLFLTVKGHSWNRTTLLKTAQGIWEDAGLERKKIHEVRHTLGTLAGKSFEVGMVQAAMGHRSRKSAEVYFHPDEDMAAEVREKIITKLSQDTRKMPEVEGIPGNCGEAIWEEITCPHCKRKHIRAKE